MTVATGLAGSATTDRISVSSSGELGNNASFTGAISADGRYVAFSSDASNLVSGDTNGDEDVFVRDRQLSMTERVSVASTGDQASRRSYSYRQAISADGRYVVFDSDASNLVSGDTNGDEDVFVRDRELGTTTRVRVSSAGAQGNNDSGQYRPAISANGRYIAFDSRASNLVPGDTNGTKDVFVRDRKSHTTRRVSVSSTGDQAHGLSFEPAISANGRYVAFSSFARNLVSGDTNRDTDVFVRDRKRHTTRRVSVSSTGHQGNGESDFSAISADGRYVAFDSTASNLVPDDTNRNEDVFLRDRKRHATMMVSVSSSGDPGNDFSGGAAISADGRYVAFDSAASNLVGGDTKRTRDVFVRGPLP